MKSIMAVALIAGFVAAEVPSHSYLPPPPRGYSSGPAVVTARALLLETRQPEHSGEHTTIGFARSSQPGDHTGHGPQVRFNDEQGYDQNASVRNGLDDVNATVSYEADERGITPQVSHEDSDDLARSSPGYDDNANNFRSTNAYGVDQNVGNGYRGNDQNGGRPSARSGNGYN